MTPTPRPRLPLWRRIGHVLVLLLGWGLFAWLWWLVLRRFNEERYFWLLATVSLVVIPSLTLLWVRHNMALHRRLGPRRGVRQAPSPATTDFNGRRIEADWTLLTGAQCVRVRLDGQAKTFERWTPPGTDPAPRDAQPGIPGPPSRPAARGPLTELVP